MSGGNPGEGLEHRLQLPRSTHPGDLLTMIRNLRPEARADDSGAIDLGEGARLLPAEGPRRAGRFTLQVPREREPAPPEPIPDSHGYARAFPGGLPFGAERRSLDLLWTLARRLGGTVVTADGARLEPHPHQVRDLTVVSPYALAPESLLELLDPVEPEVAPEPAPDPTRGYALSIPLEGGDLIAVRVGPSAVPLALSALDWVRRGVDYEIRHLPADPEEDAQETPEAATAARWSAVHGRIGMIAGVIVEAVGGYVVDLEGVLVDPADLA